jgi:HPr kinase/phosphorylase
MNTAPDKTIYTQEIHATALIIGECGLLLRGKSGAGKSSFALKLIDAAQLRGQFASLVGDDRVRLFATHDRIIAKPHHIIEGVIEMRGLGIVPISHEKACIIKLVIDIDEVLERIPAPQDQFIAILGIKLYRISVWCNDPSVTNVLHALKQFGLIL